MNCSMKGHARKMCLLSWQDMLSAMNLHDLMCLVFFGARSTYLYIGAMCALNYIWQNVNNYWWDYRYFSLTIYSADRLTGPPVSGVSQYGNMVYTLYNTALWKLLTWGTKHFHHCETRGERTRSSWSIMGRSHISYLSLTGLPHFDFSLEWDLFGWVQW